ncbi:hypothetical protein A2165_04070 [Candidatus Curtissbacteria bacterium RBG_13_40_7]|uniref:Uncharacterized protein n=1 Tax=Candidatus Curtissbacteria bacterium RBG_13_40_7 TaxID=1797706 RepID=A0A1F5FZF9_9BACT|nr:MAG: hypothetical protein A2165_04070 [Candidatus Curtissbacteria bacterium RBG_13_40_7]
MTEQKHGIDNIIYEDPDPDYQVFLKALLNVGTLRELPDTDERATAFVQEEPMVAERIGATIDHVIGEFGRQRK